jgi:RNA polymerase sigma-70 factor, ECF subfamily
MLTFTEAAADPALPDERVVDLVRGGDRDRFEVLMRCYNQRIYRVVHSFITDEAEVEDVMQQAYLRAYLGLGQLGHGQKVASWLVRIAAHAAIDRLRQRNRRAEVGLVDSDGDGDGDEGEGQLMSAIRGPEQRFADRELATLLEAALAELPEIYRAVFVLREIEGLSTDEVAQALGLSEPAVKVRLHRSKHKLRQHLLAQVGRASNEVYVFEAPRCDRVVSAVLTAIRASGI